MAKIVGALQWLQEQARIWHAFIDTLSPPFKTAYYAVETGALLSLSTMAGNYYFCLTNHSNFNWPSQLHEFNIALQLSLWKAVWDLLKMIGQPAAQPQNGNSK